jgi:hypothetical protein
MTAQSHQLLLLPQRLKLAAEFAAAVKAGTTGSGVLLSGPNGVGKSGVGLLSYLLCAARRLPVVYLSRTETWDEEAQQGMGHAHLLTCFWKQNADLIAASEALRDVFTAALRDEEGAFTLHVMTELREVAQQSGLGIGVILDEVQHITAAVRAGQAEGATAGQRTAGDFFRQNWHDWMNFNYVFVRMSIASAHGERDFKLPGGEEHRLRVVEPLSEDQRNALQTHSGSPAYISDAAARERVVFYSGNILRTLMEAARGLPLEKAALQAEVQRRLKIRYRAMQDDCRRWLEGLSTGERKEAAKTAMGLVYGKLSWTAAKGLYDAGIVYRTAESDLVRPVSLAASSAYLTTIATYILGAAQPLSSYTNGPERGFALETQVLTRLFTVSVLMANKLLDGSPTDARFFSSSYVLPFDTLDEVVPRDTPVLYRPAPGNFPCDGILMPAAGDEEGVLIVLECSVTDPREAKRVSKVLKYLQPDGVVAELKRRFPAQPLLVALVYDGDLNTKKLSADALALSRGECPGAAAGAAVPVATVPVPVGTVPVVRVFDRQSLVTLGVVF